LEIRSVELVPLTAGKAHVGRMALELPVPAERRDALQNRIAEFLAASTWSIQREQRDQPLDLRPLVAALELTETGLRMWLWVRQSGSARPREVLEALQIADLEEQGAFLTRTHVELQEHQLAASLASGAASARDEDDWTHAQKDTHEARDAD